MSKTKCYNCGSKKTTITYKTASAYSEGPKKICKKCRVVVNDKMNLK